MDMMKTLIYLSTKVIIFIFFGDLSTRQGLDFNKLFKKGVSYLNNVEEEKCRKTLEEQYKKRKDFLNAQQNGNNDIIPIPEENKEFVDDIIRKRLENFLTSEERELQLPKCNAFLRRLIYQTNTEIFLDKIQFETRATERDRTLYATKLRNREERNEMEKKRYDELVDQMEDYIGISKVIRIIVESVS